MFTHTHIFISPILYICINGFFAGGWKIHFAIWLMRTCKRAMNSGAVAIQVGVKNAITPNTQIIWGKFNFQVLLRFYNVIKKILTFLLYKILNFRFKCKLCTIKIQWPNENRANGKLRWQMRKSCVISIG